MTRRKKPRIPTDPSSSSERTSAAQYPGRCHSVTRRMEQPETLCSTQSVDRCGGGKEKLCNRFVAVVFLRFGRDRNRCQLCGFLLRLLDFPGVHQKVCGLEWPASAPCALPSDAARCRWRFRCSRTNSWQVLAGSKVYNSHFLAPSSSITAPDMRTHMALRIPSPQQDYRS